MLNPEVLKRHEDLIKQGLTMDNKFFICENITSLAIWGPGGGGGGLQ